MLRTGFLAAAVLVASLGLSPAASAAPVTPHPKPAVDLVNPFVGTKAGAPDFGTGGGAGNTYPGATVPFGMVQLSPDTILQDANLSGGYGYDDDHLAGFSLTHMSGAGCTTYRDISFLPTTRTVFASPASPLSYNLRTPFQPAFDHAHESASPGSYHVALDPGTRRQIGVDLSATTRTGAAVIRFPKGKNATMLVNAGASAMANAGASVRIHPKAREITGSASSGLFCYQGGYYDVHFVAKFDRPFTVHGTWRKQVLKKNGVYAKDRSPVALNYGPIPGAPPRLPTDPGSTSQAGAYVGFDTRHDRTVRVRVGLSFISEPQARRNLQAEQPRFAFQQVRAHARHAWEQALSHARITGGSTEHRRIFETALYHALLQPRTFSDANGQYAGMDHRTHTARGYTQYADFSGWDVYRSQIPLLGLLYPRRASDLVTSMIADYRQSGQLPTWSFANQQTDEMTGDPSDQAIAGAWAMGARHFDAKAALKAMVKGATVAPLHVPHQYLERPGLTEYQALDYLPAEEEHHLGGLGSFTDPGLVWGPSATTLEYADADWAIGAFARSAGLRSPASEALLKRGGSWRNVFNPASGYVQPRSLTGAFTPGFDPTSGDSFVEGDGAQYSFNVLHDPAGLFRAMGGRTAAEARLDHFFTKLNDGPSSEFAFLGNEPSLHTPYLYDWVGAPAKGARVLRSAMDGLYSAGPSGLPGNDDLGTMSAWWVLGALGFYPVSPGSPRLAVGSPMFPRADLLVGHHHLRITARHAPAVYVGSLRVGGKARNTPFLTAGELHRVHRLAFTMSAKPTRWGQTTSPRATTAASTPSTASSRTRP